MWSGYSKLPDARLIDGLAYSHRRAFARSTTDNHRAIMYTQDPDTILGSLKGQKILIQDLKVLFKEWPFKVNIHLERLRNEVNVWLEE